MDSVVSPETAIRIGNLGGLGVLNLEGLWTRYEDPEPLLAEIAELDDAAATKRLQEIYGEPIKEELIGQRIKEVRDGRSGASAAVPRDERHQLSGRLVVGGAEPRPVRTLWRMSTTTSSVPAGLHNLLFVWSPNAWDGRYATDPQAYYPGAAYVDMVGVDDYIDSPDTMTLRAL
jgi:IMP dehydrogenase